MRNGLVQRILIRTAALFVAYAIFAACSSHHGAPNRGILALLGLAQPAGQAAQRYAAGGTVTGLLLGTNSVTLQLNGSERLTISSNTSFQFATPLAESASYSAIVTDATGSGWTSANCMVSSNTGTIASSNVTNLKVDCSGTLYAMRAIVTGLASGNSIILQNNAVMDLPINANGTTPFLGPGVPVGSDFSVSVKAMAANASTQVCTPSANTGTVSTNPTTIAIVCSPDYFTISGTTAAGAGYSGLAGSGLKLRLNNTGEELTLNNPPSAGAIMFTRPVTNATAYQVVVSQQPSNLNQTCAVANGNGTVTGADVTNVTVVCLTNLFTVSGTIAGMTGGDTLTLLLNGGANQVVSAANPVFSWNATADDYSISVQAGADTAIAKTCSVTNSSGTFNGANITNVSVICSFNRHTVGGHVSGLCAGQQLTMQKSGGGSLIVSGNSPFTFPDQNDLSPYTLSLGATPSAVSCTIANGSGFVPNGDNVTNAVVSCFGCGSCNGGGAFTVVWAENRSFEVNNASGGGHRIHYQTSPGVTTASAGLKVVPNTASTTSSVVNGLTTGCTYYVRVQGYSAINATGGGLSSEMAVTVP